MYYDEDYPDVPYTFSDARLYDVGGVCPFQATGSVGMGNFYFRVRNGGASLDIEMDGRNYANGYHESMDVYTAEYGYSDGYCSYEDFERIFDVLVANYRSMKVPVNDPDAAEYNYGDLTNIVHNEWDFDPTSNFSAEIADGRISIRMSLCGGIATVSTDDDYERELNIETDEYDYATNSFKDEAQMIDVFNKLIADYR